MFEDKKRILALHSAQIAGLFCFLVPSFLAFLCALSAKTKTTNEEEIKHLNRLIGFFFLGLSSYLIAFGIMNFLNIHILNVNLGFFVLVILNIILGYRIKDAMAEIMFGTSDIEFSLANTLTHKDPAYYIGK